jgi:hypothetical protein
MVVISANRLMVLLIRNRAMVLGANANDRADGMDVHWPNIQGRYKSMSLAMIA